MNVKRTQAQRSEATRSALIGAGRELFGARGYARVGTEEIVARAVSSRRKSASRTRLLASTS